RMCRADLRSVRLPGAGPMDAVLAADGHACVGVYGAPGLENLRDGEVRVWDTTSGDRRLTIVPYRGDPLHGGLVMPALSQDGRSFSLPGYAALKVWDAATGRERLALDPPPGKWRVWACAIDRTGSRVAALLIEFGPKSQVTQAVCKVWAVDGGKE